MVLEYVGDFIVMPATDLAGNGVRNGRWWRRQQYQHCRPWCVVDSRLFFASSDMKSRAELVTVLCENDNSADCVFGSVHGLLCFLSRDAPSSGSASFAKDTNGNTPRKRPNRLTSRSTRSASQFVLRAHIWNSCAYLE